MSTPLRASVSPQPRLRINCSAVSGLNRSRLRLACLTSVLGLVLGCTSQVASNGGNGKPSTNNAAKPGPIGGGNGSGGGGSTTPPTGVGSVPPPTQVVVNTMLDENPVGTCGAGPIKPGGSYLRRLTNPEFVASGRDLLNLPQTELTNVRLFAEGTSNNAAGLRVSSAHAALYYDAAESIANQALSTPERRAQLAPCELSGASDNCLKQLIEKVIWRGFRQNVTQQQKDGLLTLAHAAVNAADPDPYKAAKLVIQGVLNSPFFLYKKDTTNDGPLMPVPNPAWKQLSSYSLLERMSYFILGTLPDEAMMQQALTEQYDRSSNAVALARQMLADPRAKEGLYRFVEDWLNLPKVLKVPRDKNRYPEWNETLAQSMLRESQRYLEDFYWADNANFTDLLTSSYSYVDSGIAPIYGLQAQGAAQKVTFAANQPRGGFLTLPALLTLTVVGGDVLAPIVRGKYIRDTFLCSSPPLPPATLKIPTPSADTNVSVRKRLASHSTDPTCAACHQQLDPVGFGLEQYDLIGRFNPKGFEQENLIGKGRLYGLLGDPEFLGAKELEQLLHDSNATRGCIVKHLQSYAFERGIGEIDACTVADTFKAFEAGKYNLKELIVSLVSSDSFRHITPGVQ